MTGKTSVIALAGLFALASTRAAASPRDVFVEPGVKIHVLDEGRSAPSMPPLVLIPGWRLPATIWSDQIARFSKGRRVIAIDPRSQGGSSMVLDGNTPEQRAQDLRKVLDQLRVGRFVLVGWSQGVQDVAAYVNRYGTTDVAGIVLVDSTVSAGASTVLSAPQAAARTLETVRTYVDHPRELTRGMLGAIISRQMPARETDAFVEQMMRTPTAIGAAMLVADLLGADRTAALGRIDRPTLVIASARSYELREQAAMAARIPGSQFRVIPDAAHTVFVDQPVAFNALVDRFLTEQVDRQR